MDGQARLPRAQLVHGKSYTIAVHNTGTYTHDLLIDGHGLDDVGIHNKAPISAGRSKSFTVKFPKAGTYELYCAIPGHRAKGMQLKLVVTVQVLAAGSQHNPQTGPVGRTRGKRQCDPERTRQEGRSPFNRARR